jgi:hypothetical protein
VRSEGLLAWQRLGMRNSVEHDRGRVVLWLKGVLSLSCQMPTCLLLKKILHRRSPQLECRQNPMPVCSGSGIALLSDPQLRRSCKCVSPGPISSTRAPARFHACSLALAVLSCQTRSIAGAIGA